MRYMMPSEVERIYQRRIDVEIGGSRSSTYESEYTKPVRVKKEQRTDHILDRREMIVGVGISPLVLCIFQSM